MTWEILFIFGLLVFAIVSFIWERISADLTSLTVFGILLFISMLTNSDALPTLEATLISLESESMTGMSTMTTGVLLTKAETPATPRTMINMKPR